MVGMIVGFSPFLPGRFMKEYGDYGGKVARSSITEKSEPKKKKKIAQSTTNTQIKRECR